MKTSTQDTALFHNGQNASKEHAEANPLPKSGRPPDLFVPNPKLRLRDQLELDPAISQLERPVEVAFHAGRLPRKESSAPKIQAPRGDQHWTKTIR